MIATVDTVYTVYAYASMKEVWDEYAALTIELFDTTMGDTIEYARIIPHPKIWTPGQRCSGFRRTALQLTRRSLHPG